MLCPELVGRDGEVDRLHRRLDGLTAGGGGVVALVGEPGAGKSRLVREVAGAAALRGSTVLSGRAVPGGSSVPYRPLSEAFLAAFRSRPPPSGPELAGFEGHLGRLVPSWSATAAAEESPVLLAEAVVRLLGLLAEERGCVLLLDDVQWADHETVAVLDYLADALRSEPVLCVCATRPTGTASEMFGRIERRDPDAIVQVGRLDQPDVVRMVATCLATADPPAGLSGFVLDHSDGNPFLVEELLAGLVAAGGLREQEGHWDIAGQLTPAVPANLRDSIRQRLGRLDDDARRVLGAAALLGRHFEWELLPGIAEVDGRSAADALRAAVAEQLIEVDGDGFVFRHALTREAVLADLLPPERQALAARAWPAVELANPGLPGSTCELAADLAEAAGDCDAAAERLVESARRALASGAFATAEATARRAQRLAADGGTAAVDADEVLVHVLGAAGKPADALALGRDLARRLDRTDADVERRADLLVAIARAGLAAGDLAGAGEAVDDARQAGTTDLPAAVSARIDAVAAEVALDRADLGLAEALCRRAIEGARTTEQPAVLCEALIVLGRLLRPVDDVAALGAFEDAARAASSAALPRWHLRAQQELALQSWTDEGSPAPLERTRELAAGYGAHVTVAVMDLSLADIALSGYDREGCLRHAVACADASRRYGLATESVANLWLAGGYALAGDDAAMEAAIDAALAKDRDDPRILADLYGRVLLTRAFVRDELGSLRPLVDDMMEHVRRAPPTMSVYPGRIVWTLLRTIDDDDFGAAARAEFTESTRGLGLPMFDLSAELMEAVALGRSGQVAAAAAAQAERARDALLARVLNTGMVHATSIVVARAAIRDGWGEPVRWLRHAEAFFTERRYDRLARRCRTMLGEAGAPVPRRRGTTEVPQELRALGVTGREVDVLRLVIAGHSNKAIAAELVLSPKTVERHLSSLFVRLGVTDRRTLADVGGTHMTDHA